MSKLVTIREAAEFLGISPQTLRRWENEEKIPPPQRTQGGQRRYDLTKLRPQKPFFAGEHTSILQNL